MKINNKKGIELTLNTIVVMIILVIVLIVVIYFFTDTFTNNSQIITGTGTDIIEGAKTGDIN